MAFVAPCTFLKSVYSAAFPGYGYKYLAEPSNQSRHPEPASSAPSVAGCGPSPAPTHLEAATPPASIRAVETDSEGASDPCSAGLDPGLS